MSEFTLVIDRPAIEAAIAEKFCQPGHSYKQMSFVYTAEGWLTRVEIIGQKEIPHEIGN